MLVDAILCVVVVGGGGGDEVWLEGDGSEFVMGFLRMRPFFIRKIRLLLLFLLGDDKGEEEVVEAEAEAEAVLFLRRVIRTMIFLSRTVWTGRNVEWEMSLKLTRNSFLKEREY